MKFNHQTILLMVILIVGAFLRFNRLGTLLPGFVNDEASFGYNAYSLALTGKDEFGHSWPMIFTAFGEGKLPVYVYLLTPLVKFFGLNQFIVRFPSAFFGSLSILAIYLFTQSLVKFLRLKNATSWPLLSALAIAFMPWHIHFSRAAFEAIPGLFFFITGSWLLVRHNFKSSFFLFTLSVFSYTAFRLITPVWLLILLFWLKPKFPRLQLLIFILPWLFLFTSSQSLSRAQGISIFHPQSGVVGRISQRLAEHQNDSLILVRSFHNKPLEFSQDFIRRYASHFDSDFLLFSGDPNRPRYRTPSFGQILLLSAPFLLIGLYLLVAKRLYLPLLLLALAPFASSLTFETPSAIRALAMIFPLSLIIGYGLTQLKKPWLLLLLPLLAFNFFAYWDGYTKHLPVFQPYEWQGGYRELVETITPIQNDYRKIYLTDSRGTPYIYFLFYNRYLPSKWQQQAGSSLTKDEKFGFIKVGQLDNLYFVSQKCPATEWLKTNPLPEPDVLYVCTQDDLPQAQISGGIIKVLKTIYYSDQQPAFVLLAPAQYAN